MSKAHQPESIGPYEILQKLGRGGMGTVFKARHRVTGDLVAVKIASERATNHPILRTRFEKEFVVANKLDHPNLVRALDHGEQNSVPYLVMELVEGRGLDDLLREKGTLSESEAIATFSQVANALHYLHQNMIVHRDIKPGNILVATTGLTKVADFGLGKELESGSALTRSNMGMGTLEYAAPEQCEDAKQVDLRCDIYSLGVTMYVAVTGAYPFGSGNLYRVLQNKFNNHFYPVRRHRPTLSEELDLLIGRCMNSNPDKRPANCVEFLAELKKLGGERAGASAPVVSPANPATQSSVENRCGVRYSAVLKVTCASLTRADQACHGSLVDVSTKGLCLQASRRFEPKTTLHVTLNLGSEQAPAAYIVQVKWVKRFSDTVWLLGCAFGTPLSEQDLNDVLSSGSDVTREDGLRME